MRAQYLMSLLEGEWTLVLPPFRQIPHWPEAAPAADKDSMPLLPWATFFDVKALQEVQNTMEFHDFVAMHPNSEARVDTAIWLSSHDPRLTLEQLNNETFMDLPHVIWNELEPCKPSANDNYYTSRWKYDGRSLSHPRWYWEPSSYGTLRTREVRCVETNGRISEMAKHIQEAAKDQTSILLDRFETTSWDGFWHSKLFFQLRQAQAFSVQLSSIAQDFITTHFGSLPYLAAHVRRGDFKWRGDGVPPIQQIADRLLAECKRRKIKHIFIASNMDEAEFEELGKLLRFARLAVPLPHNHALHSGQVAIVEQIVCTKASLFIGTENSFFSDVIFEDMGMVQRENRAIF